MRVVFLPKRGNENNSFSEWKLNPQRDSENFNTRFPRPTLLYRRNIIKNVLTASTASNELIKFLFTKRREGPQVGHLSVVGTERHAHAGQLHSFTARRYVVGIGVYFFFFYNLVLVSLVRL